MYNKKIILLIVIVLLMTGCTRITNNIDEMVNVIMANESNYVNTVSAGYELYIPNGVKQAVDNENNQQLRIRGNNVYLYVDSISYYYKNTLNYKTDDNYNYYYRNLLLNNKTGYIGINKENDDTYFVEIVYNYSKTEFYTNERDLSYVLSNALIIQKSIKYNDNLINLGFSKDNNDGREIKYELDKPKDSESVFSTYLQESVPEESEKVELPEDN